MARGDLKTEDVKNLSRKDLETLAAGISGYPPARAGAATEEILRRDREYAERQENIQLQWTKIGAWAATVGAFAAIVGAVAAGVAAYEGWTSPPSPH